MAPEVGRTLKELLASKHVDVEDKARAFMCFKKLTSVYDDAPNPLGVGDKVTVVGLKNNKSLNGCTAILGPFDTSLNRWNVPSLDARIRPINLIKEEWKFDRVFNTSVLHNKQTYMYRIEPDMTVRCLTPNGLGGSMVLCKFPWNDGFMTGYNREAPEMSDFDAEPVHDPALVDKVLTSFLALKRF